jgi:hypothetical protein
MNSLHWLGRKFGLSAHDKDLLALPKKLQTKTQVRLLPMLPQEILKHSSTIFPLIPLLEKSTKGSM